MEFYLQKNGAECWSLSGRWRDVALPDEKSEHRKDDHDRKHDSQQPVEPSLFGMIDPVEKDARKQQRLQKDFPQSDDLREAE